jgi:hypothetical protein
MGGGGFLAYKDLGDRGLHRAHATLLGPDVRPVTTAFRPNSLKPERPGNRSSGLPGSLQPAAPCLSYPPRTPSGRVEEWNIAQGHWRLCQPPDRVGWAGCGSRYLMGQEVCLS